jgi:hypothetical protein
MVAEEVVVLIVTVWTEEYLPGAGLNEGAAATPALIV